MDHRKRMGKGSMTVEAALVMPVVLLVLFLIILLTMHVHNRAWYTAAAGEALITASTQGNSGEISPGEILRQKMSQRTGKQEFPLGNVAVRTARNGDEYKVEVDLTSLEIPGLPVWKNKITERTTRIRPVSWIRKAQAVEAWKGEHGGS